MLEAIPSEPSNRGLIITILRLQIQKTAWHSANKSGAKNDTNLHPPNRLHTVYVGPLGSSLPKGERDSDSSPGGHFCHMTHLSCLPALEGEVYVGQHPCFRPPLMPGPQADPGERRGTKSWHMWQHGRYISLQHRPRENTDSIPSVQKWRLPRLWGSAFSKKTVFEPEFYW